MILNWILSVLLILTSLFLILLILIQRGKGGGLAGAFGGSGGSSAFGTKAGDVFTRITIWTALVWFGLNLVIVFAMNHSQPTSAFGDSSKSARKVPAAPIDGKDGKAAGDDLGLPPGGPSAPFPVTVPPVKPAAK